MVYKIALTWNVQNGEQVGVTQWNHLLDALDVLDNF